MKDANIKDRFIMKKLLPVITAVMLCALSTLPGGIPKAYALGIPQFEFGAVSDTTIELDLYADAGSTCRVYRSLAGSTHVFQQVHSTNTSGTWVDTGLEPDKYYLYYCVAYGDGETKQSATRRIKTEATVPTVQLSIPNTSVDSITLRWEAYTGAVDYNIYRSIDGGASYELYLTVSGSTVIYVDSSLPMGPYHYQVKAVLSDGAEVDSNTVNHAITQGPLAAPDIYVEAHLTQVCLFPTWTSVSGATHYMLYRSTSQNGTYTRLGTYPSTVNFIQDYDVVQNQTYWYYVEAYDATRNSTSVKASGTPLTLYTPTPTPTATPTPTPTKTPTPTPTKTPTPTPTKTPTPTPTKTPTPTPTPSGPAAPDFWLTSGSTEETTVKWSWRNMSYPYPRYKIYYSTSASGTYKLVCTYNVGTNAKTGELYYSINQKPTNPLGLVSGSKYYIKMSSVDVYGNEGPMSSSPRYFYAFQPTKTEGFGSPPSYH